MATIVEKLQQAALDPKTPVSDLLRRVKYVAAKLGLGNIEDWVDHELNGYPTPPPDYRRVHGRPMGRSPYRGWMPLGGTTEPLSTIPVSQPVSALEALSASAATSGTLQIPYPDQICALLDQQNRVRGWNYCLEVPPSEPKRILDRVRTLVLEWALNLERTGIMGSEEGFDQTDKKKARAAATIVSHRVV
ncbi:hypothetical protein [Bradyrhizobium sp. SZCCHNRI1009]|uniref:AbiTii domain-containing protein n=1 Tax=Bradyrhizobium sp. SZCCHNRI1009 TaxID=3057277 RepID=UPI003966DD82